MLFDGCLLYTSTFEQGRNDFKIDEELLNNIVTENKELPDAAKRDLIIALITLKYTQSNSCLLYTSGYCAACFDGNYPTEVPTETCKNRFEGKLSERSNIRSPWECP